MMTTMRTTEHSLFYLLLFPIAIRWRVVILATMEQQCYLILGQLFMQRVANDALVCVTQSVINNGEKKKFFFLQKNSKRSICVLIALTPRTTFIAGKKKSKPSGAKRLQRKMNIRRIFNLNECSNNSDDGKFIIIYAMGVGLRANLKKKKRFHRFLRSVFGFLAVIKVSLLPRSFLWVWLLCCALSTRAKGTSTILADKSVLTARLKPAAYGEIRLL